MLPNPLYYQGLAWVDPDTFQILRLRTDLLVPRTDIGLARQTSEIWFSEVRFQSVPRVFWLPREVVVNNESLSQHSRNRYRYSDYQVFSISVEEKFHPPVKK